MELDLRTEARQSISRVILEMPHKDGLKKDVETIFNCIKGMVGSEEVSFIKAFGIMFKFDGWRPQTCKFGSRWSPGGR